MELSPYLEVIIAATIWGSGGAFVKYLNLPPTTITFFRLAVPTLFLFIFVAIKKMKIVKKDNKLMLFASSLNAIRMFFFFLAFTYTSISNAVIILYTWPIFVTTFSVIFLKEKIKRRNVLLLLLAFIGIIFVYFNKELSFANRDFLGMTSMLLSASIYSLTLVIYKKESQKYTKLETIFYQNLVGSLIFLPFLFINQPLPTITQTTVAIVYAILIGLVGYGLFFSALKKIKASTVSHLSYFEVLSGVLFGIFLFQEILTWNIVVGGLLIIISTMLLKK